MKRAGATYEEKSFPSKGFLNMRTGMTSCGACCVLYKQGVLLTCVTRRTWASALGEVVPFLVGPRVRFFGRTAEDQQTLRERREPPARESQVSSVDRFRGPEIRGSTQLQPPDSALSFFLLQWPPFFQLVWGRVPIPLKPTKKDARFFPWKSTGHLSLPSC